MSRSSPRSSSRSSDPLERGPALGRLVPCLMLEHGHVMVPGEGGPVPARDSSGARPDVFDVADALTAQYPRLYVVDLDGLERNRPQLDYLQELARDADIWVDAGPRTGDQAIDILVTGASRAVLDTGHLESERELKRAWRLSTDLVVEVEVSESGRVTAREPAWNGSELSDTARAVRAVGVQELIVSPRTGSPDWPSIAGLASGGSVWVDGVFEVAQKPFLVESGAAGGIFHITTFLSEWSPPPIRETETEPG